MDTTTAETATRTELVGNVRDLRHVPLRQIAAQAAARAGNTAGRAGEFNSSI